MGAAGGGVRRITSGSISGFKEAAANAFQFVDQIYGPRTRCHLYGQRRSSTVGGVLLVEEYLPGTEYSAEGLTDEQGRVASLVIQRKGKTVEQPAFRDLEYVATYPLHAESIAVRRCVEQLVGVVQYKNRPFHIELKRDGQGTPKPIEFNPRMGGGSIMDLVSTIHGTDLLAVPLSRFLHRISKRRVFVTRVVQPERTGVLKRYEGLQYVRDQSDCVFLKRIVAPGHRIKSLRTETYLIEFCIAGVQEKVTRRRADYLQSRIKPVLA
jgi:hypothetical protein